jgi:tellurite resistance protein TerC
MNPFEGSDFSEIAFILLQVIILDGILSLDNAAILGTMAAKLPKDAPAPLAPWFQNILGKNQQAASLKAGLLGSYIGRGSMLVLVGIIIAIPLLKALGALYLLNLVARHFEIYKKIDRHTGIFTFLGKISEATKSVPKRLGIKSNSTSPNSLLNKIVTNPFWRVVITIEIMDLVFSLDNVIAVVALSDHITVIIFGVFISIVILRFASILFIRLITFEPLLMHAAYVLILAIGIELLLKYFEVDIKEIVQFTISMLIITGFIIVGQVGRRLGWIKSKQEGPEKTRSDAEPGTSSSK